MGRPKKERLIIKLSIQKYLNKQEEKYDQQIEKMLIDLLGKNLRTEKEWKELIQTTLTRKIE